MLPASRSLIWATVPTNVTEGVPVPPTVTPVVPAAALSTPSSTVSVTVTSLTPASGSATDNPVPCSVSVVCSVAL